MMRCVIFPALHFMTYLAVAALIGCAEAPREVVHERVIVRESPRPQLSPGPGGTLSNNTASPRVAGPTTYPGAADIEEDADYFYDQLAPYGQWIEVEDYGPCWRPNDSPPGWRPYTLGRWAYTDECGWFWVTDEPFGWCCYHYGRWAFVE